MGGAERCVPHKQTAAPVQQHLRPGDAFTAPARERAAAQCLQQAARRRQQACSMAGLAAAQRQCPELWQSQENVGSASTGISTAASHTTDCARTARITLAYAFAVPFASATGSRAPSTETSQFNSD
jgi:hypothetical protein